MNRPRSRILIIPLAIGLVLAVSSIATTTPADGATAQPTAAPQDTAVALFVGSGRAQAAVGPGGVVGPVMSAEQFAASVSSPSDALQSAADGFFANGGSTLFVVLVSDESAAALVAALAADAVAPLVETGADLLAVPALGSLDGPDYVAVAAALGSATELRAIALLDPPTSVVQAAMASDPTPLVELADQLRSTVPDPSSMVLYSSGLVDAVSGAAVPAVGPMAGLIVANDTANGMTTPAAGLNLPLTGVEPVYAVSNDSLDPLEIAGVDPFRHVVGYGTVMWGDRTLAAADGAPESRLLNVRMIMNSIQQTMSLALLSVVFEPNDSFAWQVVEQSLSTYLTGLWAEGVLLGTSAADAFTVECGIGTTMTVDDVLNGVIAVQVQVAITAPGQYIELSNTGEMAT